MLKDNIKKARLKVGLTQSEVAEKLGVAQAQYARWENGGRNPKDETVEKLAEIFGTSFEILKGRDDGLEEIVSLLREYELTEADKNKIIKTLKVVVGEHKVNNIREQKKQAKGFIKRWENRGNERQDSQSFWLDLLQSVY